MKTKVERMRDWEKDLMAQLDQLASLRDDLSILQAQEYIIDEVEELIFEAYYRGRENGQKLQLEKLNAQAGK